MIFPSESQMSKSCLKCGIDKPLSEFYTHSGTTDGHFSKCKACAILDTKSNIAKRSLEPEWVAEEAERQKKVAAHNACRRIIPPKGFHNHHWSYKPKHHKDLILLSAKDHVLVHKYLVYDSVNFIYITVDGRPLDTKERHLDYIDGIISTNSKMSEAA